MDYKDFHDWVKRYNFTSLPTLENNFYIQRPVLEFINWSTSFEDVMQVEKEERNINIYGWVIEKNWQKHDIEQSKKIYRTREDAMHAVMQMKRTTYSSVEFLIKPIYEFDKKTWRKHIILKIIDN
jgi:hypothetical protein